MLFIFSILFLCFSFLSRRSRLRQSLSLLMHTTQISKAVLSTMMLISCRRQSVLLRRRMNRPRVWVYPRDQQWFGEIHRNPSMHGFFRGHFRMSFDSFQALCRILPYSEAYAGVFGVCLFVEGRGSRVTSRGSRVNSRGSRVYGRGSRLTSRGSKNF